MSPSSQRSTGLLAWFAANPVAANLLMILIIVGGIIGFSTMDKEVFPRFSPQQIDITAEYPGAGPLEIEESVCIRIEEAVIDMPGVKRLNSSIREGECTVEVSMLADYDQDQAINALRGRIQNIPRLPKNLEKINVQPALRNGDDGVIWVALHGPTDPLTLQRFGEHTRTDLEQIPGVLRVRNYGEIPYEIVIEIAAAKLNQYRLSLHDVADAVRRASLDRTGGLVKTPAGELQLRVKGKAQDAAGIGNLVLRTHADGTRLRLGDVAVIRD
ncbi:MAG: efflux RND transporter permease subunit, partial [Methylococcaceae bacterium]